MHPPLSITHMTDCCLSELFRWWSVALMLSNTQISHSFTIHRSQILLFSPCSFLIKSGIIPCIHVRFRVTRDCCFLCIAVLSCLCMTSAYLLCICNIHRQSRRKLNHTDGYNDQWCLTEGDNSNCAWPSLAANRSMPACPQNVKWQLMEGLERQTRMRLFPKWILQKPVVFFPPHGW